MRFTTRMGPDSLWTFFILSFSVSSVSLQQMIDEDKLLKVQFASPEEAKKFEDFVADNNIDVWSQTPNFATVAVSESQEDLVKKNFKAEVVVTDLKKAAEESMTENEKERRKTKRQRSSGGFIPSQYFAPFQQINKWLERAAREVKFVTIRSIGKTHRGRDMKIIRIGIGPETKPAVFVIGGIHAREWLSVTTVSYIANKLIIGRLGHHPRIVEILKKFDFYFLPVGNPDGYQLTFKSPKFRFWRKTLRKLKSGSYGVDANRNFAANFGVNERERCKNPRSACYPGPHPFSENCTINIRDFVMSSSIKGRIKLFYGVHAYGQMYLVPYAFDSSKKPVDDEEVRRVAKISMDALMKVNGRTFKLGSPGEILYNASGTILDWMKDTAGIKYPYGIEVFPKSRSKIGFLARPKDIRPAGAEIEEAILTAAENIKV